MRASIDPTLKAVLDAHVEQAGSQLAAANQLQVSRQYLNRVMGGITPGSNRVLKALGLRRVTKTFYVAEGAKDEHPDTTKARLYAHLCDLLGASNHAEAVQAIEALKKAPTP